MTAINLGCMVSILIVSADVNWITTTVFTNRLFVEMSVIRATLQELRSSLHGASKWDIWFVWLWLAGPFSI